MRSRSNAGRVMRVFAFILVGILLFLAFVAIYLSQFDINDYKGQLQSQISDVIGKKVIFQGNLSIAYSLYPTIVVEQSHIVNPDWASRSYFASIDQFYLRLELFPLLVKEIKVDSILITNADILFEANSSGKNNWQFLEAYTSQQGTGNVNLKEIVIKDSLIRLRNIGEITESLNISNAIISRSSSNPLKVELLANYNALPVSFEMETGSIEQPTKFNESSTFKLQVVAGQNELGLNGLVTNLDTGRELVGDIYIEGTNFSELFPKVTNIFPDSLEYDITAKVKATLDDLGISGINGKIISSNTDRNIHVHDGNLTVGKQTALSSYIELEHAGLKIDVELSGANFDKMKTGIFPASGVIKSGNSSIKFDGMLSDLLTIPRAEFDIEMRGSNAATLQTLVSKKIPEVGAYDIDMHLSATTNKLNISIVSAQIYDSVIVGAVSIDRNVTPVQIFSDLSTDSIDLSLYKTKGGYKKEAKQEAMLDIPVNFSLSENLDLNLRFRVGEINGFDLPLNDVDVNLHALGNKLSVTPLKFKIPGAAINGSIQFLLDEKTSMITASLRSNAVDIGEVFSGSLEESRFSGKAGNVTFKLDGKARTLHELFKNGNMHVVLQDAKIAYIDGDTPLMFDFNKLQASSAVGQPVNIIYAGSANTLPFSGKMTVGHLVDHINKVTPIPVEFDSTVADSRFLIEGTIAKAHPVEGLDLNFALNGKNLKSLSPLFSGKLQMSGPYSLKGDLTTRGEVYELANIKGFLNRSDLSGKLMINNNNNIRNIVGKLHAKKFFYNDFMAKNRDLKVNDGRVFPNIEIPVSVFDSVTLDVGIMIDSLIVSDVNYNDLNVHATIDDKRLVIDPLTATLSGGNVNSHFTLDANGKVPLVIFRLDGKNVDYGGLLATAGLTNKVKGVADINLKLSGTGNTTRELFGKSNGFIELISGKGEINQSKLDLWASDLITHSLTSAWRTEKTSEVNCTVVRIDVRDGIAISDIILLDTSRLTVAGTGNLDLSSEELNLLFVPSPKNPSFVSLAKPVKMTGRLASPQVELVSGSKAWMLGGVLAGLANPATLLITYGKTGYVSGNPCVDAVKLRENKEIEATQSGESEPANLPTRILNRLFNPFGN